jgi:putative AlgH/UPF0301 family transcriptional regulator
MIHTVTLNHYKESDFSLIKHQFNVSFYNSVLRQIEFWKTQEDVKSVSGPLTNDKGTVLSFNVQNKDNSIITITEYYKINKQ